MQGEVYAVARWAGIPTKTLRARLGDGETLKSVAAMRKHVAPRIGARVTAFIGDATREFRQAAEGIEAKRRAMVALHRAQRRALIGTQAFRAADEARERSRRFRGGLLGIWDRVTGRHARLRLQNENEVILAERREIEQREALIDRQLAARRQLQAELRQMRSTHLREVTQLQRDCAAIVTIVQKPEAPAETIGDDDTLRKRRRRSGPAPPAP